MPHVLVQLRRSAEQELALAALIDDLHRPDSPNFHHWLHPHEFGAKYGLVAADIDAFTGWLQSFGLKVNCVYPNGTLIDVGGTAHQIQAALHTEIHHLVANGVKHYANMSDPKVPAALAPALVGMVGLHDFSPLQTNKLKVRDTFSDQYGTYQAVTPADLATIYNLKPLFDSGISGQGQTIALVEISNLYSDGDWTAYRSALGLSGYDQGNLITVHPAPPSGLSNCLDPGGANFLTALPTQEAEIATAAAPNATIEIASCADQAGSGHLIATQNLINSEAPPSIISMVIGDCEALNGPTVNAAFNLAFQQAVTEGISVFVSAGGEGAAACETSSWGATHGIAISGIASTPYNVAVGGTDFGDTVAGTTNSYWSSSNTATYGSALSYVPEIAWNESCASVLAFNFYGFATAYGAGGFCNSALGGPEDVLAGGGGPSSCASGVAAVAGVVSGTCAGTPKPSWQAGVAGIANDSVRDIPDISAFGSFGYWKHFYPICWTFSSYGAPCTGDPSTWPRRGGGLGTPFMAGVQALVNEKNGGSQGNPNYVYYKLAAKEFGTGGNSSCNATNGSAIDSSCTFHDVTKGDIDVPCRGSVDCYLTTGNLGVLSTSDAAPVIAFGAAVGWDFATGIGTVNALNLVNNWSNTQASAPVDPSITNYQIVSEEQVTPTLSRVMYRADLVNPGSSFAAVSAVATSSDSTTIRIVPGQDTLRFAPVPANSETTSLNTFSVLVNPSAPAALSSLHFTLQMVAGPLQANAGPNQSATVGSLVTLNGDGSTSAGGALSYSWFFVSLPPSSATVINNPADVRPTFLVDVAGTYIVRLTVSSGGATSSGTVQVSTQHTPPVANAGPNQIVLVGATITLDGSGSFDGNGNPITYAWQISSMPSGSSATLTNPTALNPTFIADRAGNYVVDLVVNDGVSNSHVATVTISATEPAN